MPRSGPTAETSAMLVPVSGVAFCADALAVLDSCMDPPNAPAWFTPLQPPAKLNPPPPRPCSPPPHPRQKLTPPVLSADGTEKLGPVAAGPKAPDEFCAST